MVHEDGLAVASHQRDNWLEGRWVNNDTRTHQWDVRAVEVTRVSLTVAALVTDQHDIVGATKR